MSFSNKLLSWYYINKRDLPWRNTRDPYCIWLSEIILQQTQVKQGLPYYRRFINAYPTIKDLAAASEDNVLKIWQGLGYYSRARNLHFTAKYIVLKYGGEFPKNYEEVLALKGVGFYTAAAITSFAFDLPYAVVDGNVVRVLSRVFGIQESFDTSEGKRIFRKIAQDLLIKKNPSEYNQSIMEFGAIQCVSKSPDCTICPMHHFCYAYQRDEISNFPIRLKKKKIKDRFLHFLMLETDREVYITKRTSGIWRGLYEFPFIEFSTSISEESVLGSSSWNAIFRNNNIEIRSVSDEFSHVLSHQKLHAKFWRISVNNINLTDFQLIEKEKLSTYPVSRLMEKYLESIELI